MSKISIKPITGSQVRIIVKPDPAETRTAAGIIIPDSAKEKPQKGEIVAIGNDLKDDIAHVNVGDRVIFSKYSGTELKWEGEDYLIMKESDLLAII